MASFPESNIYMQCYTLFSADLDLLIQIFFFYLKCLRLIALFKISDQRQIKRIYDYTARPLSPII